MPNICSREKFYKNVLVEGENKDEELYDFDNNDFIL